jgi:hypothetical protein
VTTNWPERNNNYKSECKLFSSSFIETRESILKIISHLKREQKTFFPLVFAVEEWKTRCIVDAKLKLQLHKNKQKSNDNVAAFLPLRRTQKKRRF